MFMLEDRKESGGMQPIFGRTVSVKTKLYNRWILKMTISFFEIKLNLKPNLI